MASSKQPEEEILNVLGRAGRPIINTRSLSAWAKTNSFDKLKTLDREQRKAERHTAFWLVNHYYVVASIFSAHLVMQTLRTRENFELYYRYFVNILIIKISFG